MRHNTPESKWNSFEQLTSCKYKPYRDKSFHLPTPDPSSDTTLDMGSGCYDFSENSRLPTVVPEWDKTRDKLNARKHTPYSTLSRVPRNCVTRRRPKKMTRFPPPNCQRTSGFMDRMISPTHHSPLTTHSYFAISSRMLSRVLFVKSIIMSKGQKHDSYGMCRQPVL